MSQRSSAAHRRRLGRSFARMWSGFALASSGDGLAYGAVPLLAVAVDPHPFAVSVVAAADTLPWLLLAVPAGHLADRFDRSRIIALTNALRAAVMLAAAVLILHYRISLAALITIVLLNACGRTIYFSSVQAMAPGLIDDRDLEQANGILNGTEAGAENLAGPVVGTVLFSVAKALPFLTDGIALVDVLSPVPRLPHQGSRSPTRADPAPHPPCSRAYACSSPITGCASSCSWSPRWPVSRAWRAACWSSWPPRCGASPRAPTASSWPPARRVPSSGAFSPTASPDASAAPARLIAAATASGVGYLVMASAMHWELAAPAFALVGLAVGAGSVVAMSLRQRLTPDDLMGRVGGAWRGIVWGAAPIGALAAGAIAVAGGLRLPLVLAGILQIAIALVLARPLLKSIEHTRRSRRPAQRLDSSSEHTVS